MFKQNSTQQDERAVIGSLVANAEAVQKEICDLGLTTTSFKDRDCKAVFDAFTRLTAKGTPIDVLTIHTESGLPAQTVEALMMEAVNMGHVRFHAIQVQNADLKARAVKIISQADGGEAMRFALQQIEELLPGQTVGGLPSIENGESFAARDIQRPVEVIRGILYAAAKMVYGGPSKANKTWVLYDLGLAVATGGTWLGFHCTRGRVLYINLELQAFDAQDRVRMIAKARGVNVPSLLDVWNLRGFAVDIEELKPHILKMAMGAGYSLIIVDPCYKVMGDREENNPRDIASMLNHFEDIAVRTGAAFAYGAHFAKGNSSSKNAIDRISGSGVHARDPDAILTATPHNTEGCFTIDATLRSFARVEPFAIRWDFPRMVKDETLDPCDLKQATTGRPAEHTLKDILCHVGSEPVTAKEWKRLCTEDGVPLRGFYRLRKQAINSRAVIKTDDDSFTLQKGRYD
jgi:AAA domain/DnaB-like helicase N terminal domain